MKYVEIDPHTGTVSWDAYFEYIRAHQSSFPADLYDYASDWERYSLDGANSLHDAWLIGVDIDVKENRLTIALLGARHDRKHVLEYSDVSAYSLQVTSEFKYGDRDVLAHEFRVDSDAIIHEIVFSNRGTIVVRAREIRPSSQMLS